MQCRQELLSWFLLFLKRQSQKARGHSAHLEIMEVLRDIFKGVNLLPSALKHQIKNTGVLPMKDIMVGKRDTANARWFLPSRIPERLRWRIEGMLLDMFVFYFKRAGSEMMIQLFFFAWTNNIRFPVIPVDIARASIRHWLL
jgi:hypothetical protein